MLNFIPLSLICKTDFHNNAVIHKTFGLPWCSFQELVPIHRKLWFQGTNKLIFRNIEEIHPGRHFPTLPCK